MAVKGAKTITEYYFRKWMEENFLEPDVFILEVNGHEGVLKDQNGDTLKLVYDAKNRMVFPV